MAEPAGDGAELFHGQPSLSLRLPGGDSVRVLLHGAHVVSWIAGGRERLYLSPRSRFDGQSAIRGGVPVCFPQFNQRGPLPKHGFARNLPWQLDAGPQLGGDQARLTLRLRDSAATRRFLPQAFAAKLTIDLQPGSLRLTLDVQNTDVLPLAFTGALHTYLAVDDIAGARLQGLGGQPEWDALTDRHARADDVLHFRGEFDRVYGAATQALLLQDGARRLLIEQSPSFAETVVWNPGADKAATLADMSPQDHAHMLCVEAAQLMQPVTVAPGASWTGWQGLRLA